MSIFRILVAALVVCACALNAQAVTLTLWETEAEQAQIVMDRVIADFQKLNPKISVRRSHYKVEDIRTQFQTAAMGGGGAGLVFAPNDFGGPFSIMGIINPVESWVKPERFDDMTIKAVTDPKGRIWGVPVSKGNHLMLIINGNMVTKIPPTMDELVVEAKKWSSPKENKFGLVYNLAEPFWIIPFLLGFGQHPFVNGEPQLDNPAMEKTLNLVRGLKFDHKVVPPDCDYNCADTLFVEGKVPMLINGDWSIDKYERRLGDKLIIAPLPKVSTDGQYASPYISGRYLFFNVKLKGEHLKAAKMFAEYLVSPDVQELMIKEIGRLPSLKQVKLSEAYKSNKTMQKIDEAMVHGSPMPMNIEMRVIWDAIRPQLQNVMAGRTDAKKAMALMQKDAVRKIEEMKR